MNEQARTTWINRQLARLVNARGCCWGFLFFLKRMEKVERVKTHLSWAHVALCATLKDLERE